MCRKKMPSKFGKFFVGPRTRRPPCLMPMSSPPRPREPTVTKRAKQQSKSIRWFISGILQICVLTQQVSKKVLIGSHARVVPIIPTLRPSPSLLRFHSVPRDLAARKEMAASRTTSPNGKWRRPSHRQRPATPSVRLQEEAGCHNDLASAVPAGRPMMSTISNTFADYNIDDEEEEEESSSAEGAEGGDDDGDEYVVQVRPLPKIRLDLCPAPREEDEYRDQNRKSSRRRRSSSRDTSSSPSKASPNKSKEGQKDSGASVDLTSSTLNSTFTSTASTDKDGNNELLDIAKDAAGLLPQRQNEHPQQVSTIGKAQETSQGAVRTNVDADGFPIIPSFGESSHEKEESPLAAPLFAPNPSPALAIHHEKSSTKSHGSSRLPVSNGAVAPSDANEKRKHTDAREEDESQASPTTVADIDPDSSPHRPSTGSKHLRRNKDRSIRDKDQRTSPARSTEGRQEDDRRRRRRKGARRIEDEERSIDDCNDHGDNTHEIEVDEKEGPSLIFDWLLTICGDLSSFVSEGVLGIDGENSQPKKQGGNELRSHDEDQAKTRRSKTGGKYDLDHFRW